MEDGHAIESCPAFGAAHSDDGRREELDLDRIIGAEVCRRILDGLERRDADAAGKAKKARHEKRKARLPLVLVLRYHANISRH